MNTFTSSALIAVELLADCNKKPSALQLDFGVVAGGSLLPLLEHPDFRALTGQLPCLAVWEDTASTEPAFVEAVQKAGCELLSPKTVYRTDHLFPQSLSPGAQWVAGNWYLAPPAKPSGSQVISRSLAMQLVQLVCADADTHEIEAVLRRDPALSYHLLRLVNSLGMGLSKRITSFSQAILLLGRAQLRRWLNLMLFSAQSGDERSSMLLARVAMRSRMMELLAKAAGLDKSEQELAFMTGMFSLLGILFGLPLAEVLQPLKVSADLLDAILEHKGELGCQLQLVKAAEHADRGAAAALLDVLQISPAEFNLLTVQACAWMLDLVREGNGGSSA